MSITLGGSRVELMHPGPAHTDDMTVLLFPEQRAVFGVDFLSIRSIPPTLGGYSVGQYVDANARVQDLVFDILIPGHGDVGEKSDLMHFPDYLRAVEAAVVRGIAERRSLEGMRENVSFPDLEVCALSLRDDARRLNSIT